MIWEGWEDRFIPFTTIELLGCLLAGFVLEFGS